MRLREQLRRIIEQNDTGPGRTVDFVVQGLILVSLVCFAWETLPGLSAGTRLWLERAEFVVVAVFTAEYLLRLWLAESKAGFVFSFLGLVDLLAVLPFYLQTGIDLRSLRAVRLLRLFSALKLVRYSRALQRFHRAFLIAREELILFLAVTVLMLYFAAVGIYYCEREAQPEAFASILHGMWWAVATLTTVGYGDAYPVTPGGKLFTFLVLMIGLGIVAVPAGLVSSALSKARDQEQGGSRDA